MSRFKKAVAPNLHHIGLAVNRLKIDHAAHERAFAEQWAVENEMTPTSPPLLLQLIPDCTQEQATAVATVIQWLGSNVGQGFLYAAGRRYYSRPGADNAVRRTAAHDIDPLSGEYAATRGNFSR